MVSADGSWSSWEGHDCVSGTNPTMVTYDRVCNVPTVASYDGGLYRCSPDGTNSVSSFTKTESCASGTPVCYAGGTCGCEKVSGAATKERGDGSSQGSCATATETCYSDGICRSKNKSLLITYR